MFIHVPLGVKSLSGVVALRVNVVGLVLEVGLVLMGVPDGVKIGYGISHYKPSQPTSQVQLVE